MLVFALVAGDGQVIGDDDKYYQFTIRTATESFGFMVRGRDFRAVSAVSSPYKSPNELMYIGSNSSGHVIAYTTMNGQSVRVYARVDVFDYGLSGGSNTPPTTPPTRYAYFGASLSSVAPVDVDLVADRISIHQTAFGDFDVTGIDPGELVRLWWAVDEDLPAPSSWSSGLEDLTDVVSQQPSRTLGGRNYILWMLDTPNAVGPLFNGRTVTVS